VVKSFVKCLAHDGTLERCVPLVPQRHTLLSRALNMPKIQFLFCAELEFQYDGLKATGCLSYSVMRPSAWSRDHLSNVQYGGLEAPGCLPYPVVRPSTRFRDHLRT
jgi:hypothetical protein